METSTNNRVKVAREYLGLNQTIFSKKLNVTQSYISRVESNLAEVNIELVNALYNIFSINMMWLLTGVGDMFIYKFTNETFISPIVRFDTSHLSGFNKHYHLNDRIDMTDEKISFQFELSRQSFSNSHLIALVEKSFMENYGIAKNDMVVFRKLLENESLENSVVILHEYNSELKENYVYLRYYDAKTNKLLSGSKDLLPIDYDPEIVVPAKITAIIRPI